MQNSTTFSLKNSSTSALEEERRSLLLGFVFYGIMGSIVAILNPPIFLCVLIYRKLRKEKEFIIVAGLALADAIDGSTYVLQSLSSIRLLFSGKGFIGIFFAKVYPRIGSHQKVAIS